jgi:hypothetical protein
VQAVFLPMANSSFNEKIFKTLPETTKNLNNKETQNPAFITTKI